MLIRMLVLMSILFLSAHAFADEVKTAELEQAKSDMKSAETSSAKDSTPVEEVVGTATSPKKTAVSTSEDVHGGTKKNNEERNIKPAAGAEEAKTKEKEKEAELEELEVTAPLRDVLPPGARVPAVVESITKETLESINVVGTEDDIRVEKKDGKFLVLYGHVDKNKFEPVELMKVKETKGFDRNGKDVTVNIVQDKDRLSIASAKDLEAVTLLFDSGFVVKTTEGYKHISKREAKEYIDSMQYIEAMHSMQFSKTLFGWNSRFSEPLGMRFEIVPLKNPFDVKIGEPLPIKVLFGGKPFADASIKVKGYGKETATELVTNKEGIADVVIEKSGVQIITASYKIPLKDNPDSDFLSLSTAMTFEMK